MSGSGLGLQTDEERETQVCSRPVASSDKLKSESSEIIMQYVRCHM